MQLDLNPIRQANCDFRHILTVQVRDPIELSGHAMTTTTDTRDAETIPSQVEPEFRRVCEAQRDSLDWYGSRPEASFSENLRRYGKTIEADAATYCRVSAKSSAYMDRLHTLLRPVQDEVFGSGAPPGRHQHTKPRSLRRLGRHRNYFSRRSSCAVGQTEFRRYGGVR
jgi:hypothetical protein